jgi:hypothetical protein
MAGMLIESEIAMVGFKLTMNLGVIPSSCSGIS